MLVHMEMWLAIALLVVVLGAALVLAAMRVGRAADRFAPNDAGRRERQRRRGSVLLVTSVMAVSSLAVLWVIGAPSDAWWVLPLALALDALLVVTIRAALRRERARNAPAEPSA